MHRARLPLQSCPFSLWQLNPACICAGWGGVWLRISCPRDFYTYFFQKQWTFVHLGKRVFSLSIGNLSFNSAGTSFVKVSKLSSHSPGATDHPFPSHLPCQGGLSLNSCPAPSLSHECLPEGVKKKRSLREKVSPFCVLGPNYSKVLFSWLLYSLSFLMGSRKHAFGDYSTFFSLHEGSFLSRFLHPKWREELLYLYSYIASMEIFCKCYLILGSIHYCRLIVISQTCVLSNRIIYDQKPKLN